MFRSIFGSPKKHPIEQRIMNEIVEHPMVIGVGRFLPMNQNDASMLMKLAKKNLEDHRNSDIYVEGEGSRLIQEILDGSENQELSTYLHRLARHGVKAGAFASWYNQSLLEQEVKFCQSQLPAMALMSKLQDQGVSGHQAAQEAVRSFPFYTKQIEDIDPDDVDASLPQEAMFLVNLYLGSILKSSSTLLVEGLQRQAESFSSINAWIRYHILKTHT